MADVNISDEAAKPAMVQVDGNLVKAVKIEEKILAENFEAVKTSKGKSSSVWAGCRMNRAVPPASTGKTLGS